MKFVVHVEKLLTEITPSQYFGVIQGNQVAAYNVMQHCVTDDSGNPLSGADAKKAIDAMSNGSMAEFQRVQSEFIRALSDALVNPTNGNG